MSAEEHLQYYAAIKGIPRGYRKEVIADLLGDVGLLDKKEQLAVALSQVNKRKLMVAIASLDKPELLLMNEPIGLSGAKKKFKLWSIVKKIAKKVVFVSHFLDEVKKYSTAVGAVSERGVEYLGSLRKDSGCKQPLIKDLAAKKSGKPIIELSFKMKNDVKAEEVMQQLQEKGIKYELVKEGVRSVLLHIDPSREVDLAETMDQLHNFIASYIITHRSY